MLELVEVLHGPRREIRRGVRGECGVFCSYWDGAVPHVLKDLSTDGAFLESDILLDVGTKVVMELVHVNDDGYREAMVVAAKVCHVSLGEADEAQVADVTESQEMDVPVRVGMGVRFLALEPRARVRLRGWIEGAPPRIDRRAPATERVWIDPLPDHASMGDGRRRTKRRAG